MICDERCWTETICTVCGRPHQPVGRSLPLEAVGGWCDDECPGYPRGYRRHLWSEHDNNRMYSDPRGWFAHVAVCQQCKEVGPSS